MALCRSCGKELIKTNEKKLFCSPACQQRHYRLKVKTKTSYKDKIDSMYRVIKGDRCAYCGNPIPTACYDHFVPLSFATDLDEKDLHKLVVADLLFLLPCCVECNSLAHDKIYTSITKKREHIQSKLKEKYRYLFEYNFCPSARTQLDRDYIVARVIWNEDDSFGNFEFPPEKEEKIKRKCIMCSRFFFAKDTTYKELFCSYGCAEKFKKAQNKISLTVFKKEIY